MRETRGGVREVLRCAQGDRLFSSLVSRLSSLVVRLSSLVSPVVLAACTSSGVLERVPIPPGSTVRVAAESLAAHGIIRSQAWFRLRARLAHTDRTVKAGIYRFARGTSTGTVLARLKAGDAMRFRITLPRGGTMFDLAQNAHETLDIPGDSILSAARDSLVLQRFELPGPSVEGWLLPESFDFGGFDVARDVIARFVSARQQEWDSTWDARAAAQHLNRRGLISLASIVEAEAKDPAERPLIAAVYRNRLRQHMALQADPTIEYAWLLRTGTRKRRLFNVDYQLDSPWNTYKHPGLPPGPIGNPSKEAIEAALNPAKVSYLYFVAGPDGKSVFATTYGEHLRNIKRVRGDE
jgi:UPF0755 protein